MINSNNNNPVPAFPVTLETTVHDSGITGYEVKDNLIIHVNADANITCHYNTDTTPGSIVIPAAAGSDFAISRYFDSIDIDASCIISKA